MSILILSILISSPSYYLLPSYSIPFYDPINSISLIHSTIYYSTLLSIPISILIYSHTYLSSISIPAYLKHYSFSHLLSSILLLLMISSILISINLSSLTIPSIYAKLLIMLNFLYLTSPLSFYSIMLKYSVAILHLINDFMYSLVVIVKLYFVILQIYLFILIYFHK